jgi:hypothetical protein
MAETLTILVFILGVSSSKSRDKFFSLNQSYNLGVKVA